MPGLDERGGDYTIPRHMEQEFMNARSVTLFYGFLAVTSWYLRLYAVFVTFLPIT